MIYNRLFLVRSNRLSLIIPSIWDMVWLFISSTASKVQSRGLLSSSLSKAIKQSRCMRAWHPLFSYLNIDLTFGACFPGLFRPHQTQNACQLQHLSCVSWWHARGISCLRLFPQNASDWLERFLVCWLPVTPNFILFLFCFLFGCLGHSMGPTWWVVHAQWVTREECVKAKFLNVSVTAH